MKPLVVLLTSILLFPGFVFGQSNYQYTIPVSLDDGLTTADLRSVTEDTSTLFNMLGKLKHDDHRIHSILVLKDGKLILEEYFSDQGFDQQHDMRSVSKSLLSILMGIAIDKGYIASVNDPIANYISIPKPNNHPDPRKDSITIAHLLTMSSGLDCDDWDKHSPGQEDRVYKQKDWIDYTLNLDMKHDPGTVSRYCSMGKVIAAEIISITSGLTIDQFAERYLFAPLGITNVSWGHTSKGDVIPSAKRLNMTSRDMAKIGLLMRNKGKWNGIEIVSEEWIEESVSPKTKISGIDYAYFWWQLPFKLGGEVVYSTTATGNGGQYISVFEDLNLVMVFTGGAYNSEEDKIPFSIISNILLPAMMIEEH